jgi:hypothetical protein
MIYDGFSSKPEPVSPSRRYFESMLSTLTLILVVVAMVTSLASAVSILGVDFNFSDGTEKSIFAGSIAIIAWLVFRSAAVAAVLLAVGYFVAMNVAKGEDGKALERNSFLLNVGMFCGVGLIVTLLGFLVDGWTAVIGAGIGGLPALRAIYKLYYELD